MIKRTLAVVVAVLMLFSVAVYYASAEGETATNTGNEHIIFTNGYIGFCLDSTKKGATAGDTFVPAEIGSNAYNVSTGEDVSNRLKILFTQCFADIFVSDGNGGYTISNTNVIAGVVWHYTNNYWPSGQIKTLVTKVDELHNGGLVIPDNGYSIEHGEEIITFDFLVMKTQLENQQDFFAYKLAISEKVDDTTSSDSPSDDTSSDDTSSDDTSSDDTSSDDTSSDDTSSDDTSSDDTSSDDTSSDDTSSDDTSSDDTSSDDTSSDDTSSDDTSSDDTSSDDTSSDDTSSDDTSSDDTSSDGDIISGDVNSNDSGNMDPGDDESEPSQNSSESGSASSKPPVAAGDSSDVWFWCILMAGCVLGAVITIKRREAI